MNLVEMTKPVLLSSALLFFVACGSGGSGTDLTPDEASLLERVEDYASNSDDNPAPTVEDYTNAGIEGVNESNINQVNALIDELNTDDVDTVEEINAIVAGINQTIAMDRIEAYASNSDNPAPTVEDYANAGIQGVTADNLNQINLAVAESEADDVDTVEEINAIVINITQITAMNRIEAYNASSSDNPAPTVEDYANAGVQGVTTNNIDDINRVIAGLEAEDVDSIEEINAIVTNITQITAMNRIKAYALDSNNPAPTVEDYANAGVQGVTADNLDQINTLIAGLDVEDVDSVEEINALIANSWINIAPVAKGQTVSLDEDTAQAILLEGTDINEDSLTYTVVTQPTNGTLTGTAPNLTYMPNSNYFGTDSFSFKVNDTKVDSAVATVNLTINPINDVPTVEAGVDKSIIITEGIRLAATGSDVEGAVGFVWREDDRILVERQVFDYIPTSTGAKYLTVTVTDNEGVSVSDSMLLMVSEEDIVVVEDNATVPVVED
jgi:hypothetical protein